MTHPFVLAIHEYIEKSVTGQIKVDQGLLDTFGERVKTNLKKQLEPEHKEFKLRMSNIGKPLRQLMLEQKYGRAKPEPEFVLRMLFGDLYESLMIFLLKASGVNIEAQDKEVTLPVKTSKGIINLNGTLDLIIDGKVYDVKSASPFSFNNKFDGKALLSGDDAFGYVDQIFGYAAAEKKGAGGWIVINKSDAEIKTEVLPDSQHDALLKASVAKITEKVCHVVEGRPMPECGGVIDEEWYGKPTGKRILGPACRFCDHKTKCNPTAQYAPNPLSKAKTPKWEWYIG